LTLVAANGTELVLNSTDIGSLPSYRAYGGYKNVLGNIKGLGNYTGVPLTTLCDLVGGISNSDILRVSASDDYSINFTYDQVKNGDFVTYDPATGDHVSHLQPLTPIVAYYKNDTDLSSADGGPLRLAIVGSEGFVTNSTYWVKYVVKLEIMTGGVPEFPSQMIVILLAIITLCVATIYWKKSARINCRRNYL
jgi:DMSO/TMAO reductase YedYZ molybdopterin-dependent catalytic subunit